MAEKEISVNAIADQIMLRQQALSENVASAVLRLFTVSVISTLGLTVLLAAIDAVFIYNKTIQPSERLITDSVVMSIIGASIVQVGASAIAIVYSLFRRPSSDSGASGGDNSIDVTDTEAAI